MTHNCCPDCGLRFSWAYVTHASACPMCLGPLTLAATAVEVLGQQLYFEAPADIPRDPGR